MHFQRKLKTVLFCYPTVRLYHIERFKNMLLNYIVVRVAQCSMLSNLIYCFTCWPMFHPFDALYEGLFLGANLMLGLISRTSENLGRRTSEF